MLITTIVLLIIGVPTGFCIKDSTARRCSLPPSLINEIQSYKPTVDGIIKTILSGAFTGELWETVAHFTDRFGNRLSGTKNLEDSIDYVLHWAGTQRLDVYTEDVTVPHWIRKAESATLLSPRVKPLSILGLGTSIGTPQPDGITADVIVVRNFKELERRSSEALNSIVLFVQKWENYGTTVNYRYEAASKAASHGAVAALIRSVTPFSLNSPHTGLQEYQKDVPKIPCAAITVEDAKMLLRMDRRSDHIIINLKMQAKTLTPTISRNTVVQSRGTCYPNQYVLISGHIDSWDVGNGAMDDAAGAFLGLLSLNVLRSSKLKPRRTIKAVFWTSEEFGLIGAKAYRAAHDKKSIVLAMESDEGTFNPTGLLMKGTHNATCIVKEILKLLAPLNATTLELSDDPASGSDISVWNNDTVPLAALRNDNNRYFWYHHTEADTMQVENSKVLDRC